LPASARPDGTKKRGQFAASIVGNCQPSKKTKYLPNP
jgi:hypothetical protein